MNDLISIIVPVYNVASYLHGCINSLRNQTYQNIEIILVNDGSTDDSAMICLEHAEQDSRIKYFEKVNGGFSDARNYGIERSGGAYITFVDSDDWVEKEYIDCLYAKITEYDADVAIANHTKFHEEDGLFYMHVYDADYYEKVYDRKEFIELLPELERIDNSFYTSWGILFKSSLFDVIRFPLGRFAEDLGTNYKLYLKADKIVYIHKSLYIYRIRSSSSNHNKSDKDILDMLELNMERIFLVHTLGYSTSQYLQYWKPQLEWFCQLLSDRAMNENQQLKQRIRELQYLLE